MEMRSFNRALSERQSRAKESYGPALSNPWTQAMIMEKNAGIPYYKKDDYSDRETRPGCGRRKRVIRDSQSRSHLRPFVVVAGAQTSVSASSLVFLDFLEIS